MSLKDDQNYNFCGNETLKDLYGSMEYVNNILIHRMSFGLLQLFLMLFCSFVFLHKNIFVIFGLPKIFCFRCIKFSPPSTQKSRTANLWTPRKTSILSSKIDILSTFLDHSTASFQDRNMQTIDFCCDF